MRLGLLRRLRAHCGRAALLIVGLLLPLSQSAHALDVYYARAIGQEYAPESPPPSPPQRDPPAAAASELPALGEGAEKEPARREMGFWSKLLIGVVLVAAVAALGDGDGGSAQMSVAPGAAPDPAPPAAPTPENGGGATNNTDAGGGAGAAGDGGGDPPAMQDAGGSPGPSGAPADPVEVQPPMETAGPGANGGGPPDGVPGADNRNGFDIEVAEDRIRVDLGNERFEFERGNGRDDDDAGRGPGRGRDDDDAGRGRGRDGDD